jgi:hypothetical protein
MGTLQPFDRFPQMRRTVEVAVRRLIQTTDLISIGQGAQRSRGTPNDSPEHRHARLALKWSS